MTVQCALCPHFCNLKEEQTGFCLVRKNVNGRIVDTGYGKLSALASDPIEKKPLYHYFPGRTILSAGFYGCNFRCPFCQNYTISQSTGMYNHDVSPQELVHTAKDKDSFGIAYTYSEPLVHYEYIMDTAKLARKAGLKNVLITNGFINQEPAKKLLKWIDAANIDLKSFNPDFYKKELKGELTPVLDFIALAVKKIHVEVTTLIIPGKNDDPAEMTALATFLASLNPDIPLHLSAYYPQYHYTIHATQPELILKLVDIAQKKLKYVYPGNIDRGNSHTACRHCGSLLVERQSYKITANLGPKGTCLSCGTPGPFTLD